LVEIGSVVSEEKIFFLYPRWPPLLKIEISSNGQNCSILSQDVPKFELYKHNEKEGGAVRHNFERDPPRDHPYQVWFNLVQRFQRRRFKCELCKHNDELFSIYYRIFYEL
jgi:hypothetical protein